MATVTTELGEVVMINYAEGQRHARLAVGKVEDTFEDRTRAELGAVELDFLAAQFRYMAARIRANGGT